MKMLLTAIMVLASTNAFAAATLVRKLTCPELSITWDSGKSVDAPTEIRLNGKKKDLVGMIMASDSTAGLDVYTLADGSLEVAIDHSVLNGFSKSDVTIEALIAGKERTLTCAFSKQTVIEF